MRTTIPTGFVVYSFQNKPDNPDIIVTCNDPNWSTILGNWMNHQPPTDSPFWNCGVIPCYVQKRGGK